jgi:hypothetical protein
MPVLALRLGVALQTFTCTSSVHSTEHDSDGGDKR